MPPKRVSLISSGALLAALALGITSATAGAPGFTEDRSADLAQQIDPAKPKSVILIIGDGMDDSMITAARNYALGADGRFAGLDNLPFTGAMTTHGLKVGAGPDYPKAYVSDSAPTASGWSTGKKTVDSRLSQGPSSADTVPGVDYETVLERFQQAGKRTGNVSTAELTDATPAAAASHLNLRECQGPANMARCGYARKSAGGKGSVAEQLVDHRIDVLLGGGRSRFAQATDAGPSVLDRARDVHGYRSVEDRAGLEAITSLAQGPVLGLFAAGNMTPMYAPLVATETGAGGPETTCQATDRGQQPDLSTMTAKAISLLDNEKGFFLQAESAMIDKQEHAIDICGAIGDLVELDETVQVALEYQAAHPDTLVIVTGDHAHSTQIVGGAGQGKYTATVKTADGDPMTVAYSTSTNGSNHTGAQIRVAASGPQAANVTGVIDQTDLFATMLGRTPSTLPSPPPSPTPSPSPAPPVTSPAKPAASVLSAGAIGRRALARRGLAVTAAAAGATKVSVRLVAQGRTVRVRTLAARGGVTRLKAGTRARTVTVVLTATGKGGTVTTSRSVRVRR